MSSQQEPTTPLSPGQGLGLLPVVFLVLALLFLAYVIYSFSMRESTIAPTGSAEHYATEADVRKAWVEMIHRYAASTLGLLIIV